MNIITLDNLKRFKDLLYRDLGVEDFTESTEVVYEYDGNSNDESRTYVTNYGGIKVFAKMGDIPAKSKLELVGATLFRTNPNNAWLDRTFEVTYEHLSKVLNKADTDIPATQDGLIQIYDMMASDFSEFTVACICTKIGWYNVCFDDWYEVIYFPEPGVYAYDKRTYGGNDYLKTLTVTVTTSSSVMPDAGEEEDPNFDPTTWTGKEFQVFSRGVCIGDSVTEGSFDAQGGGGVIKKFSFPEYMSRMTGVDVVNAGVAGLTSETWYDAAQYSDTYWGKWVNQEWVWNMYPPENGTDVISSQFDWSGFEFAIIHIGINDLAPLYDGSGTLDEILIKFENYIDLIIGNLKTANQGIRIFMATIVPSYAHPTNGAYGALNDKIKEIADRTDNAYVIDLNRWSKIANHEAYNVTHPTALGYRLLAEEIVAMIGYVIATHLDEFNDVQFIGTDYPI